MIKFIDNIVDVLPNYRESYVAKDGWFGLSFQLPGMYEGINCDVEIVKSKYSVWFEQIIDLFDSNSQWILSLDIIGEKWFPYNDNNLKKIRNLFQENKIANKFSGAIVLNKNSLSQISEELITYPYTVLSKKQMLYCDIDVFNNLYPFVIRISAHQNIDIITKEVTLMKLILNLEHSKEFIIKEYNGTNLNQIFLSLQ